ncbi:hypothetical protein [Nisaea sediminum]|uniref:hypothetical protein n=1 Tax=Nisaea sediminum TaxID=2775867 RepID=UPI001D019930|nr:hypothetical protein [Nisaea sediminum]
MSGILAGPATAALNALRAGDAVQVVTLCTPDGFRLVALDESGQPVSGETEGGRCDWCQSFGGTVLPAPACNDLHGPYEAVRTLATPLEQQTVRGNAAAGVYVTRAPPFLS